MRTVKQVSAVSRVSVRALHHYDHIGLLKPQIGDNGYRYYGRAELLRLQHILFYRELGMPLAEIARMLDDPGFDARAALIDLRQRVEVEVQQRRDLADTIDRTLAMLDADETVGEWFLFRGVSTAKQAEWEASIAAQFGETAEASILDAKTKIEGFSLTDLIDFKAEIDAIHSKIVSLIEAGGAPSSTAAQALTARHYRWVCRSWYPDGDAYTSLGRLYCEHPDFRKMYDDLHLRLAVFLGDAMAHYAVNKLSAGAR